MKRILITAGAVYGPLDDNKLVGNRVRGIWATRFAEYLCEHGHEVLLLVPDVGTPSRSQNLSNLHLITHRGYWDYSERCITLAREVSCAVLAAAVVNWIPAAPVKGKMATAGYKEGDIIQVPFVLAPRVINRMRVVNPKITLIGCKMLIGSTPDELVEAAYGGVLLPSRCNVVVANDMKAGLRTKRLVYQDRTVVDYDDDFNSFFSALRDVIDDEHYRTVSGHFLREPPDADCPDQVYLADLDARNLMTQIVEKYRDRFVHRQAGSDRVFGGVGVPFGNDVVGYLLSPREKGDAFDGGDGVVVDDVDYTTKYVGTVQGKATLNTPLLVRVMRTYGRPVLHLHEQLDGVPTVSYAPPGTVRDSERKIPGPVFNIEGHGFVACLDQDLEIMR